MARLPRAVIPGVAHHVTQRGNRRLQTFFEEDDYDLYLDLLGDAARAMGEAHLYNAFRYVALNPVRAHKVARAQDWPWSSVRAHLAGRDDHVVKVAPALERIPDFQAFLGEEFDEMLSYAALRKAESVGRPIGSNDWIAQMEAKTGMTLARQKPGRPARE